MVQWWGPGRAMGSLGEAEKQTQGREAYIEGRVRSLEVDNRGYAGKYPKI